MSVYSLNSPSIDELIKALNECPPQKMDMLFFEVRSNNPFASYTFQAVNPGKCLIKIYLDASLEVIDPSIETFIGWLKDGSILSINNVVFIYPTCVPYSFLVCTSARTKTIA